MNAIKHIDINADVGEGIGNERELFPFLSSCNIACGGHAGDKDSVDEMLKLAKEFKLKVGAHPSFPDKENFGRVVQKMSASSLFTSVRDQVLLVLKAAQENHMRVHHVKPHGALYNLAAKDKQTALVVVEVLKGFNGTLKLYAPSNSIIAEIALKEGLSVLYEVFADRNYNEDGSLVSRKLENAIITDEQLVFDHVYEMITTKKVSSITGKKIPIEADTVCVHGDTTNAVKIAKYLSEKLIENRIAIR